MTKGIEIRSAVLGEAYVNKTFKTRSMLNLAMMSVLNRPHELRTHIKAALTNGVTRDEIRETFTELDQN